DNYCYYRGGSYYYTSQYGIGMLRNAINYGYEQGYYAGRADREDGWNFDPDESYAYQDALYGYDGYYVSMDEYSYYFREGFRRGYEDGYYGQYRYGNNYGGKYQIIASILQGILNLAQY